MSGNVHNLLQFVKKLFFWCRLFVQQKTLTVFSLDFVFKGLTHNEDNLHVLQLRDNLGQIMRIEHCRKVALDGCMIGRNKAVGEGF